MPVAAPAKTILALARSTSNLGTMGGAALIADNEVQGCVEAPCPRGQGAVPRDAVRECLAAARRDPEQVERIVICGGLRAEPRYTVLPERVRGTGALRRALAAAEPALGRASLASRGALESLAAAAFLASPLPTAAMLVFCGEDTRAAVHVIEGRPAGMKAVQHLPAPHGPARLLEVFGHVLGLDPRQLTHELTYLASYGAPRHSQALLSSCVDLRPDGSFALKGALARPDWPAPAAAAHMRRSPPLPLPEPGRFDAHSADIARSVVAVLRYLLGHLAIHVRRRTGVPSICLGGDFAWTIARHRLLPEDDLFRNVWVHPQRGASALALGAALAEWQALAAPEAPRVSVPLPFLGAAHSDLSVEGFLSEMGIPCDTLPSERIPGRVADLVRHRQRVGWFRDREESGTGAAGHRLKLTMIGRPSLEALGDPRQTGRIPKPAMFAVLADQADRYFEPEPAPPFRSATVGGAWVSHWKGPGREAPAPQPGSPRPPLRGRGPVTVLRVTAQRHPALFRMLEALHERTGVPLALAEPLEDAHGRPARHPAAAFGVLRAGELDALILGSSVVLRVEGLPELPLPPDGRRVWRRALLRVAARVVGTKRTLESRLRVTPGAANAAPALPGTKLPSPRRLITRLPLAIWHGALALASWRTPPATYWRMPSGGAPRVDAPKALPPPE